MRPKNFFELVCQALPKDVTSEDLMCFGKQEWWQNKPDLACAYALRYYPRINWRAYLEVYPDVKAAAIDPVLHFLRFGIYEGRKLISWHPLRNKWPACKEPPDVSIIIPSYNNGPYLERCLTSLTEQTLTNIEIIVVEDGSTDNSLAVAKKIALRDKRIRIFKHASNLGTHQARKTGVSRAIGDYLMFLDADDSFTQDACERALKAVSAGYDGVAFGVNVISKTAYSQKEVERANVWFNRAEPGSCTRRELLDRAVNSQQINWNLCFTIVERPIAQQAFDEFDYSYIVQGEDALEFTAIAAYIRSFFVIGDKLYNYIRDSGITSAKTGGERIVPLEVGGNVLSAYRNLCAAHNLGNEFASFKRLHFRHMVGQCKNLEPQLAEVSFANICKAFSPLYSITELARDFPQLNPEIIPFLISGEALPSDDTSIIKNIAIFDFGLSFDDTSRYIISICSALLEAGYKVFMFMETKMCASVSLPPCIQIKYLSRYDNQSEAIRNHLYDLHKEIIDNNIDAILHMYPYGDIFYWDTMLSHLLGVKVFALVRKDINFEMLTRGRIFLHSWMLSSLRKIEKVICLNRSSEIYLRRKGIDAIFIPDGIKKNPVSMPFDSRAPIILVIGKIGAGFQQTGEVLEIFTQIMRRLPTARLVFAGDFKNGQIRKRFYEKTKAFGVSANISITGWLEDWQPVIDESRVIFSADFLESSPVSMAQAQMRGVPIVMYDLDLPFAEENEGVWRIPQGSREQAINALLELLLSEEEWLKRSTAALNAVSHFTEEYFRSNIANLVATYNRESMITVYSKYDYSRALRYMSFYAGKKTPADL